MGDASHFYRSALKNQKHLWNTKNCCWPFVKFSFQIIHHWLITRYKITAFYSSCCISYHSSVLEDLEKDVAVSSPVCNVFIGNTELVFIFSQYAFKTQVTEGPCMATTDEQLSPVAHVSALLGRAQLCSFIAQVGGSKLDVLSYCIPLVSVITQRLVSGH